MMLCKSEWNVRVTICADVDEIARFRPPPPDICLVIEPLKKIKSYIISKSDENIVKFCEGKEASSTNG